MPLLQLFVLPCNCLTLLVILLRAFVCHSLRLSQRNWCSLILLKHCQHELMLINKFTVQAVAPLTRLNINFKNYVLYAWEWKRSSGVVLDAHQICNNTLSTY